MKKAISLLLALTMVFSLVACTKGDTPDSSNTPGTGGTPSSNEPITINFWGHQEDSWNNTFRAIGESFHEKYPNITVNFEFYPYDEYESKVQTSLISKTGDVDVYELWGGWGVDFCSTGALAQMPDSLADTVRHDAYPCTYGALEYDGKLYGMPMEFNIESGGMLVNLHLLKENNMEIPTTWDELISDAKAATVRDGNLLKVKGFDFVGWDSVPYLLCSMIMSLGGNYLNEDGTFNFTSPEAKTAFTELTTLLMKDGITDLAGLAGGDAMENYQLLYANQVLFAPRGPWTVAEGLSTFELTYGEDFVYTALPWYGPDKGFAAETGWSLAVSGKSAKQEAAFQFLEYFFSDEVLMQANVGCGQVPAKRSVAQSPELLEKMPFLEPLVGILDDAQFIGYFNTDVFKETVNNVFTDYCTGGIYGSVDEALIDLNTKCNEKLA